MFLTDTSPRPSKVAVVLELGDREDGKQPAIVLMLEGGECVVLGGDSPIVRYFPDWSAVAYFSNTTLDEYAASHPSEYQLPDEWDTSELPLGP